MALPAPAEQQNFCHVSALEGGEFTMPLDQVLEGAHDRVLVPSLAFLLRHSSTGQTIVFDLGLLRDIHQYPPAVVEDIKQYFLPVNVPRTVSESLQEGGLDPAAVDYVIYSHLHFDHIGDTKPFTKATFIVGEGGFCPPGYPHDQHAYVASDLLPEDRTKFASRNEWSPLGPFPLSTDMLGDGSVYIIDAPGHCPGHLNLLVRTSPDGAWLLLAGDTVHDRRLFTGEGKMAVERISNGGTAGLMHDDKDFAQLHIKRVKEFAEGYKVKVIFAHDKEWFAANRGGSAFWPGQFDPVVE